MSARRRGCRRRGSSPRGRAGTCADGTGPGSRAGRPPRPRTAAESLGRVTRAAPAAWRHLDLLPDLRRLLLVARVDVVVLALEVAVDPVLLDELGDPLEARPRSPRRRFAPRPRRSFPDLRVDRAVPGRDLRGRVAGRAVDDPLRLERARPSCRPASGATAAVMPVIPAPTTATSTETSLVERADSPSPASSRPRYDGSAAALTERGNYIPVR